MVETRRAASPLRGWDPTPTGTQVAVFRLRRCDPVLGRRGKPRLYHWFLFRHQPAGCAELVTLVALLNAPLVVSALKPEILLEPLLDT